MIEAKKGEENFDKLVLRFLMKKYNFKNRIADIDNKELLGCKIWELLAIAEIESDAAISFMDLERRLLYISPIHNKLYGKRCLGENNTLYIHHQDVPILNQADELYLHNKKVCYVVVRYKCKENQYVKIKSKSFPVIDDNGKVKAIFNIINHATEDDALGVYDVK